MAPRVLLGPGRDGAPEHGASSDSYELSSVRTTWLSSQTGPAEIH